jgi:hypothetical protein
MDRVVKRSAEASCTCYQFTREPGQWTTTTGWYTGVDQLITSTVLAPRYTVDTRIALAVRCKIACCPIEAVKCAQALIAGVV